MLIHTVFFYLRDDLTPAQKQEFRRDGLESLRAIPTLENYYVGTPAPTPPRPVVDQSYTFAITCMFKDLAAHDVYQAHPIHLAFVEKFKRCWTRVQVYDAL